MSKEEVLRRLSVLFKDLFAAQEITENMGKNDISEWDSLGHLRLFMAVEEDMGLKFTISEMAQVQSVGQLVELIMQKQQ